MKKFFEVFDTLNLPKDIESLLTDTFVTRVTITRDRKLIRIHILSSHLIDKRTVYALEKAIKEQLFGRKEITVRIAEEFHLSAQYNPRTLYDLYRDSILLEMKNYDIVLYNMLTRGKLSWTADDTLSLTVPESNLYKTAAKKPAAKKSTAGKKAASGKTAAKADEKKPAAKKTAAKRTPAKKTAAKKSTEEKTKE